MEKSLGPLGNIGLVCPSSKPVDVEEGGPVLADDQGLDQADLKQMITALAVQMRRHFEKHDLQIEKLLRQKGIPEIRSEPVSPLPWEKQVSPRRVPAPEVRDAYSRNLAGFPDSFPNPDEDWSGWPSGKGDTMDPVERGEKRVVQKKKTMKVNSGFQDSLEQETNYHSKKADMKRSASIEGSAFSTSEAEKAVSWEALFRKPRKMARVLISKKAFESAVMFLIFVNVVVVGIEVDIAARSRQSAVDPVFTYLDRTFTGIFAAELLLKLWALGCHDFFFGGDRTWNTFDFGVVSMSLAEILISVFGSLNQLFAASHLRVLRVLRLARAFRGIRAMRLLRFIGSLRTLMQSIVNTLRSLAWTVLLLIMIFYTFGVAFTQAISDHCRDEAAAATGDEDALPKCGSEDINQQWLSLPRSMLTLFKTATNGIAWQDVTNPLSTVSLFLVLVFIMYFAFTFFAVLNVVTGVFCHTAIESANSDKDIAIRVQLANHKNYVKAIKGMFQDMDVDGSNSITIDEFERTLSDASMKAYLASIEVDTVDAWTLFSLIDRDMSGCIDLDEFVTGCLNLRGPAKALHIAKMSYENKHMRQMMKSLMESNASLHEHLDAITCRMDLPHLERQSILEVNPALSLVEREVSPG
eukprot:TRINITY_DN47618_c0_g1_i1.p1 TRINITY_DN47618_c0_g1~~TRINITY_DN47618_c0_g1_i1.p1  ORF type:complete len:651 (-),score=115.72 TRINITY_DN47618_c0_g1_i1:8-1918(-)